MASIFSTQNLQTFLRRKYLRPPSRPPGPPGPRPGPPGRGPRPRSPPPDGRSGRSPAGRSGRSVAADAAAAGAAFGLSLLSSAIAFPLRILFIAVFAALISVGPGSNDFRFTVADLLGRGRTS